MESRGEATAKDRSRFPSGMTTRKAKATHTSESMYGAPGSVGGSHPGSGGGSDPASVGGSAPGSIGVRKPEAGE